MEGFSVGVGIAAGVGVLVLMFKPIFGNAQGFGQCVKFWLTPDVFSLFRGEYCEDRWNEMKLGLWIAMGVITSVCVSVALMKVLG